MEKLKRIHISKPEIFVILTLLILGSITAILTPFSAGWDEETHLIRVWQMADLHFIPNDVKRNELPYPTIYYELSYRQDPIIRRVEPDFWETYGDLSLDSKYYIFRKLPTRSVYSPLLLFPQAMVMRYLGRAWDLPALKVFYACRFASLLSYLVLAWLAVRLIPFGQWVFAILAVSPMALFQSATVNADAISNGIGLFFISTCLAVNNKKDLGWKELTVLICLVFLLFNAKVNLAFLVLLPLIIITPSRFRVKTGYILFIIAIIILGLVVVVGWNSLAYNKIERGFDQANPRGQINFILTNLPQFLQILFVSSWNRFTIYFMEWVGVYGYKYWSVPKITYILYPLAILLALITSGKSLSPDKRTRLGLLVVFLMTTVVTFLSLYISFNSVGNPFIHGVQGKYFLSIVPLLLLAIAETPIFQKFRINPKASIATAVTALLVFLTGLSLSYHLICGTKYYEKGLCYQPYYKNWAPDLLYSPLISSQMSLTQEIIPECDGVTRLRIWLNASEMNDDGIVEFILHNSSKDETIFEHKATKNELPNGDLYVVDFPPDWNSTGQTYLLTIQSEDSSIIRGPKIAYTLRHEYLLGRLYENQDEMNQDIIFQYGCLTGLEKIIRTFRP